VAISFTAPYWLLLILPLWAYIYWMFRRGKRGRLGGKRNILLILRVLVVLFLVLSLAGVNFIKNSDRVSLLFVSDLSFSTAEKRENMNQFIRDALKQKPNNYQVGLISFGKDALVEYPLSSDVSFTRLETVPNGSFTNIAAGLQLAEALLPGDTRKQIVLLTDGRENMGEGLKQAEYMAGQEIRLDGVLFPSEWGEEAQISHLELPSYLYQGESFDIQIRIDSTVNTRGTLHLYSNRQLVSRQQIEIQAGENHFIFQDKAAEGGIRTYEAVLEPERDGISQNNRMAAFVNIRGLPVVLLVEGRKGEGRELGKAVEAAGYKVEYRSPQTMSPDMEELRRYQGIVLVNVNGDDLTEEKMEVLETYVRHLGRGLLVTGGDSSYALGGYMKTPLEKILPVDMDVKNRMDIPSLGLILVIDKSSSMTEGQYGISKLDLAKEAAIRSTEALKERDIIGVIAFDDSPQWVVKAQQLKNIEEIQDAIGTIRPGGGTMLYGPLRQAVDALEKEKTKLKHIIALTDGQPADTGFEGLVMEMKEKGITLSTVAVGREANHELLEYLAREGNGRFYAADEFSNIPKVFTKETYLASQNYVQNRSFFPVVTSNSSVIDDFSGFPVLQGYIATTAKNSASMILASDRQDPILAEWRYGLGRVMAWTSDVQGIWTQEWLKWKDVPRFWGNVISRILPEGEDEGGDLTIRLMGDRGEVVFRTAELVEEDLNTQAIVIDPDGMEQKIQMNVEKPGEYKGYFNADEPGVYIVRLEQKKGEEPVSRLESGLSVSYSSEFDIRQGNTEDFLKKLVVRTGGSILDQPGDVFRGEITPIQSKSELWPWLLPLALVFFVFDIALRRLRWDKMTFRIPLRMAIPGKKGKDPLKQKSEESNAVVESLGVQIDRVREDEGQESETEADKKGEEGDQEGFASKLLEARKGRQRRRL
jgi:Mg-chelatase subunit ChlD